MSYMTLERDLKGLTATQQDAVVLFVRFLLSQKSAHGLRSSGNCFVSVPSQEDRRIPRPLGGFEKGFYMSPDFDEPLADFSEYM